MLFPVIAAAVGLCGCRSALPVEAQSDVKFAQGDDPEPQYPQWGFDGIHGTDNRRFPYNHPVPFWDEAHKQRVSSVPLRVPVGGKIFADRMDYRT